MPLATGARLGPYEILAAIGAGGMGEVYKARDTRLNRTVAIKVLPNDLAENPDLRARFEREARAVAALDHPHICGIYDVGSVDSTHYLVMPHLEGQTLAARLEKGPLPLDQALKIAAEIADALDKAHRQGIVHRDLKPANIMLTRSGLKLLDFGLAKLSAPAGLISMSAMTQMATGAAPATAHGLILGTVQYMAPEQVEGKEADARSDIWAIGAVVYEMVSGTRPFLGDTPASVIGAILKDQPSLISASQPLAPRTLDHLVSTCLAKEPDQRWQSAADVASMLSWIVRNPRDTVTAPRARSRLPPLAGWIIAAVLLVALGIAVTRPSGVESPDTSSEPIVFHVYPPFGRAFAAGGASVPVPQLAVSPDGRHLVFVAAEPQGQPYLWLRTLGEKESRRLPGTEGAEVPFWAPDSRMVGFFAQSALKKFDIRWSASPETIGPATTDMRGGSWSPSGVVVYSSPSNDGLLKIRATGTDKTTVDFKDSQVAFHTARWPFFLPDGDRFLFLVRDDPERRGIYVGSLAGSGAQRVAGYDWGAQYANGHLLLLRESALMAQPFDPISGTLSSSPTTIVEQVAGSSAGYGSFSVSATGVLAYSSGFLPATELRWVDRAGKATDPVAPVGDYVDLRLSPEESRLAFSRTDPRNQAPDVWVRDLTRGTEARVASDTLTDSAPLWSPSGDQLIFRSNRGNGIVELYQTPPIAGTEVVTIYSMEQVRLTHGAFPSNLWPTDWSPDGRFIIYQISLGGTGIDIWALPLVGERKPVPIASAQHNEVQGYVSPNGRWLAYASDESGRYEIYVQSFPDASTGGKTTISNGGGTQPRWSKNGRELFYLRSDGMLMAVAVKTQPTFEPSTVTPLFKTPLPTTMNTYRMDYVPAADGQRFLMKVPVENTPPPSITVVLNWPSLLKR